ncbi:uncharacterized protein J8A68_001207 [[Candida] subhashii]|uniref:Uncharacterized protein n=1 Tax=[Candida] subhashii TaxID=561895 RepID=A0A8J5QIB2_9ASCO|nr:uncharacterized protein J8A68_001207 [[Candida] subhashii]KAG7665151.1 hypothetical protein J8A68_001207 [[Candida] subhashii]
MSEINHEGDNNGSAGPSSPQETQAPSDNAPPRTKTTPQPKKSKKQRKPQTEEEYAQQLELWEKSGPTINDDTWLFKDLDLLDSNKKIDRVKILHACERMYYESNWKRCLELIEIGEKVFEVDLDEVGQELKEGLDKQRKRVRKSAKLERHVVDLYNIKTRCLERMQESEQ